MTAIVIRGNTKATWLTGPASLRAKASGVVRRAMACAAAAAMVCTAGAALIQLVAQLLSFSAPIAVTGITVTAVALLNSLRWALRTRAGHRRARGTRMASSGKPGRI